MTDAGQSADLAVVMPVFNEEGCIAAVVADWRHVLEGLGCRYRLIVLDDGSRDQTPAILDRLSADPVLQIVHQPNAGHGPTILHGYALAVAQADWVFQCDGDNEMRAEHFPRLWQIRDAFDAVFGVRTGRKSNWDRRLISGTSRQLVRLLFGRGVTDVNVPYRLIRAPLLAEIVRQMPNDTFAPNVIIAGAITRARLRIANLPIPHAPRRTGQVSIMKWRLWRSAVRAAWQTFRCRPRLRPGSNGRT